MRFVPVPYEALAEANTAKLRLVVLGLYERAHAFGWLAMRMTVRQIAEYGDARSEDVLSLLDGLEARGLIIRDKGRRGVSGSIRVFDPSKLEQRRACPPEQRDPPPPPVPADDWNSGTDANWNSVEDTGARGEPSEPEQQRMTRENARANNIEPSASTAIDSVNTTTNAVENDSLEETLIMAELQEVQTRGSCGTARWRMTDKLAIRGAIAEWGVDTLRRLAEYFLRSNEFEPASARGKPYFAWSTLLNRKRETRRDLSDAWHERGKVDTPEAPTSRGPPRNGHSKTTEGDMLLRMFQDYRDRPDGGPHGE